MMQIQLSPHILVRKAGLPYNLLDRCTMPRTRQAISDWLAAEQQVTELSNQLAAFLYDFIPAQQDDGIRHELMTLRRQLKKTKNPQRWLQQPQLWRGWPVIEQQTAVQLTQAWQQLEQAQAAAQSGLRHDLDHGVRPALRRSLQSADFVHALALNNPRLYQKALKQSEWNDGKLTSSKTERSLFSYMARASAKTSPLSTFMANLPAEYAPTGRSELRVSKLETLIHPEINRGVIARICRFIQQDLRWFQDIRLEKNSSLDWQQGAVRVLANVHIELLGRPWRQQQPMQARFPQWLAEQLQQLPDQFSWRHLQQLLTQRDEAQANHLMNQLLDLDIITPTVLWHGQAAQPIQCLLQELTEHGTEHAKPLLAELEQLQQLEQQFIHAQNHELALLSQRIDRHIDQIYLRIGARFVEPYQSNCGETVWQQGASIKFGRGLYQLASHIGHSISDRIRLDPAYALLQHEFIQQFGVGGRCDNVLDFLHSQAAGFKQRSYDFASQLQLQQTRMGVTLYGQLICADLAELERGGGTMVLNLLYERLGWQACRYLPVGQRGAAQTAELLTDWLNQAAVEGAEVVEISLSSECNSLQSHRYVTSKVLGWPGESIEAERCLPLAQLELRHDEVSNQLQFCKSDGQPVQLCYLGGVMPQPDWGLSYLLIKLTEPFHLVRPQHLFQVRNEKNDVEHTARISEGPLVLYRETWRVRASVLQQLAQEMPEPQRLKLAEQLRRQLGLPSQCFVAGEVAGSALDAQELNQDRYRKPMWFDFANPLCLEHLLKLIAICPRLTFREALPSGQQLWFRHGDESYVTELQMEVLVSLQQEVERYAV